MRSFLAGIALIISLAGAARGQATGFVTGLGFQSVYRPDAWTPLRVHLESTVGNADEYQIQVRQEDLDKDTVVYTRTVALGPQAKQDFWAYFIPQPTDRGLPDVASRVPLGDVLRVYLYDKTGQTPICPLPVQFSASNIDPKVENSFENRRGRKLVLCVITTDKPSFGEYVDARGLAEDVEAITVRPSDLPDSVLGYAAVDAVLWLDANARDLSAGGSTAFDALQQYVQGGGQLVVCQPQQRQNLAPFADADMLPVVARDAAGEWAIDFVGRSDLKPLIDLSKRDVIDSPLPRWKTVEATKTWDIARATARPDAVVNAWVDWDAAGATTQPSAASSAVHPAGRSPYLARRAYGLGSVTWVAQDLGDPTLTNNTGGWPHVWDSVFGWKNDTRTLLEVKEAAADAEKEANEVGNGNVVDLGASLLKAMEHSSRGTALIVLAVLFFVVYWVAAGPGSYLILAARKKKGLSWSVFAGLAVVATLITVGLVKLVLGGRPEVRHLSIVRMTPAGLDQAGNPRWATEIDSRFGLYIPRDGRQDVSLADTTAGQVNYVIPFAVHPQHIKETGFPDRAKYEVDTDQFAAGKNVTTRVPYRSTLKKLQARWSGMSAPGVLVEGTAAPEVVEPRKVDDPLRPGKKIEGGLLKGKLHNKTGRDLTSVYFAFRLGSTGDEDTATSKDWLLYVPTWGNDAVLDLGQEISAAADIGVGGAAPGNSPEGVKGVLDPLFWPRFWYSKMNGQQEIGYSDSDEKYRRSMPLMALFDRIQPQRPDASNANHHTSLLRRGGREMNMSQLVAAGKLVIFAQADGPIPLPLQVNGDRVSGEGVTFYEMAIPLKPIAPAAATHPASAPATRGR